MNLDPLLTERQVADWLGVSERFVRTLRAEGKLAYINLAKRVIRYDSADVLALIERSRVVAEANKPTGRITLRRSTPSGIIPFSQRKR